MGQHMQFDDPLQNPFEEPETYTPRQVNSDLPEPEPEQTQTDEPVSTTTENVHPYEAGYERYEPGYAGRSQQRGEKLSGVNARPRKQRFRIRAGTRTGKRRGWLIVLAVLVALLILLNLIGSAISNLGLGTTSHASPARNFTVNQHATITVQDSVGNISVLHGSGNQVSVTATVRDDLFGHNPQVTYANPDSNTVNIAVQDGRSGANFINLSGVDLAITVPDNMNLDLHTSEGNVEINGVQGQVTIQNATGNITIKDATLSGEGDIQSNTGNVNFNGKFADDANYRLHTNAGNVNANFSPDENVYIDAHTSAGNINSDLPQVPVNDKGPVTKDAQGFLGGGKNQAVVWLATDAGNVHVGGQ